MTELKKKCCNCGIPNDKGMYCKKCDCIIYVSFIFDDYISEASQRMEFLESIESAGVNSVQSLRAESSKRQKPLMMSLANKIDHMTRVFPQDIASEVFRRALTKSKGKAENMARNTQIDTDARNEAFRAVSMAMAEVTEPKDKKMTSAQKAYDGFNHANEEMTEFFD